MSDPGAEQRPIAAVGVVCLRGEDVLLVRRGKPPLEQHWSIPGGRIEWGERAIDAALRELREETSVTAEIVGLVDVVDALMSRSSPPSSTESARPWGHYVLIDYAAVWTAGEPIAGDDAAEARFFSPAELESLGLWDETLRVILTARLMLQG